MSVELYSQKLSCNYLLKVRRSYTILSQFKQIYMLPDYTCSQTIQNNCVLVIEIFMLAGQGVEVLYTSFSYDPSIIVCANNGNICISVIT